KKVYPCLLWYYRGMVCKRCNGPIPEERLKFKACYCSKKCYDRTYKTLTAAAARRRDATKRKNFSFIVNKMKARPCEDCGIQHPTHVMDFDHRDATEKKFTVSRANSSNGVSWRALLKEVAKCDVVCANCHRM